jgi:hypothetical protein
MATKTLTTKTGSTIQINFERRVQDKVAYADGYNIVVGREIVELTEIILSKEGKVIASGRELSMLSPKIPSNAKYIAQGAVARVGEAFVRQEVADKIAAALAELDAENPKSEEQLAIEQAKAEAHARWEAEAPARWEAEKFERRMDDPNSDL